MRTRLFVRTGWALTAVLALALTGCQSLRDGAGDPPADDVAAGGSDEAPADPGPGGVPAGVGAPVVQVWSGGGFVPVGWDFSQVPELTVYEDGTIITPGPQIRIYPGPLLPYVLVSQLDAADVEAIVAAARAAGLLTAAPDYGMPGVADLPTTHIAITVDGVTYEHAAYALGYVSGEGMDGAGVDGEGVDGAGVDGEGVGGEGVGGEGVDGEGVGGEGVGGAGVGGEGVPPAVVSGLTEEQVAARAVLAEFLTQVNGIALAEADTTEYAPTAVAMFAWALEGSDAATQPEAEVVPWPIDTPLADAHECTVIDGDAASVLLTALGTATQTTYFEQDGVTYQAWVRPLLPHETSCAAIG